MTIQPKKLQQEFEELRRGKSGQSGRHKEPSRAEIEKGRSGKAGGSCERGMEIVEK